MARFRLSSTELSFWYQYKFDPCSDANNIVHRIVIPKNIDEQALRTAFDKLIRKHPALRSRFLEADGLPYRITSQSGDINLVDGTGMSDEDRLDKIRKPFVLDRASHLRVIFVLDKGSTTLLIGCPHIIFDAQSWNILLDDFTKALIGNFDSTEYSLEYPKNEPSAQQYWKSRVGNVNGRVSFEQSINTITDSNRSGVIEQIDESSLFEKLIEFGKAEKLSISTLCIAILSITLSKMTDSEGMIIALPVSTRDDDSANKIGAYINVLPCVIMVDRDDSFQRYAKAQSRQIWGDIENSNFSLIDLISDMSARDYGDNQGIYNVMAEYVPFTEPNSLVIKDEIIPNKCAKMDLILSVIATAKNHKIISEYDSSKFNSSYIEQTIKVFFHIANSILTNPNQPIKEITLINEGEARNLLEIGKGPVKEMRPPFVWNRFKTAVRKNSNSVAVIERDRTLSYKQLYEMSCMYAGFFIEKGITEGSVVGVNMDRSANFIASILAIWSLGAVYVPLDTKQPVARLKYMIKQAGISVVVMRGKGKEISDEVMRCDIEDSYGSHHRDDSYEPMGEDLAYVIFTSGSTGTPKGVMIGHEGFLNHLEIMIEGLSLTKKDVIAQTAPVSFDISVWQLICAFMVGASVVVVDYEDLIDSDRMYKIIASNNVSVLEVVPSLLSSYLTAEYSDKLYGQLRHVKVITTGEAIDSSVVEQWINHYPDKPLLNAYGPAEASDDTHFFNILPNSVKPGRSIPIGSPLINIQTYIVNAEMQLCPKGVIGEICIGGIAVAKGYIGNEQLTAELFLPNRFMNQDGSCLYRTGDYGRWRNDNLLEFHGRRDNQVKVRGQRLELGEVENRLKEMPGVMDAAVIADKSPSGTRLLGYIVPRTLNSSIDGIKEQLRSELPDYMIPWRLEFILSLPRSGNGKLDRKALEEYLRKSQHINPANKGKNHTQLLRQILQVYSAIFNKTVGSDSNYFDLGGDSLQSMKIVAMLGKNNIHVGIRDLLMYQTPEELASDIVKKQTRKALDDEGTPILDGLNPIQNNYVESAGKSYRDNGEIQTAIITLGDASDLNSDLLLSALNGIMEAHEELKPEIGSSPLVIDGTLTTKDRKMSEIIEELRAKISLKTPLIGFMLPSRAEKRILLVAHHLTLDFYSWSIIKEELEDILSRGHPRKTKENILKRWWGKTLDGLIVDKHRLEEATKFWKSIDDETHYVNNGTDRTEHYTYDHPLSKSTAQDLSKCRVSLESFANYIVIKACLAVSDTETFSYNIESSLRSIDATGALSEGIGWMTYLFPQKVNKQSMHNTSLDSFHKASSEAIRRGYEYGLLRYNIFPELFNNTNEPLWTINYLGKSMESIDRVEILRTLTIKGKPFIEIDISYDDNQLSFDYSHNTKLTKTYFDAIDKEISRVIVEVVGDIQTKRNKPRLSTKRKEAILQRLRNAKRN
ncbi:MAG: amino acid adenylation domain-containing protein [Candidatus Uhrbacteria bacterium]|nr:amino acid adenylation domain-containing protein [Candidatus Uhrbacteria bacterium]